MPPSALAESPVVLPSLAERLRSRGWFARRHIRAAALALLGIEIAVFAFLVAGTHGWIVPLATPTTTDFVSFYAAGLLANGGAPHLAYDQAVHLATEEAVTAAGIQYQFFNYPPVFLLLCSEFARLPYLVAFVAFEAITLAIYLLVARRVVNETSGTTVLVLLAFPAVFWNIGLGQNAFLTAALFGAATLTIDRRPVVAGLLFGAVCYKPHFGLLVPLALAAGGHWKAFAAAAVSAVSLVLVSLALYGADTWRDFLAVAGASHDMYASGRILFAGMVSPFGAVRLVGGGVTLAYAVQAVAGLFAAGVVVAVWRRRLSLPVRAAVLTSATLVALPLSLIYDTMLGAVAALWLLRDDGKGGAGTGEKTVMAVLFVVLLDARNLAETIHVPVLTLAAGAIFALAVRRAWHELAESRPPAAKIDREKGIRLA